MDISNSLVQAAVNRQALTSRDANHEATEKFDQSKSQPPSRQVEPADSDLLAKVSDERNENRIQRVNSLEAAPLRTQQAVNRYQQTVDASQEYEQGELVGVDLFV